MAGRLPDDAEDGGHGGGGIFAEINITPLTDVFLVLLIIFMVSALAVQAEAQQLQATPATSPGDAVGALRTALTQRLGNTAQLNMAGDRATVTLKGASADALAQWLAQARSNARATPLEARLTRSAAPAAAAPTGNAPVTLGSTPVAMPRWDGTVVLALPAAPAR